MKRVSRLAVLVLALAVVVAASVRLQAWNPATHIYIAEKVYPAYAQSNDLIYGAIAPDLAMYVPPGYSWDSAFWDTHWVAIDLRPWAWNAAQRAFAKGWITHNEMYGADKYAHGYPPLYLAGYVTLRANILAALANITPDLAHYAIEIAVDVRMQTFWPYLADQLLAVAQSPPPSALAVLSRALVWWPLQRTDVQTLMATQKTFDTIVSGYALALRTSSLQNYEDMVTFAYTVGSQLDPTITKDEVRQLLGVAMAMTADCQPAIALTIKAVAASVPK